MFGFGSLSLVDIAILIFCVVHAIRTNRIFPWIYIIVFLPLIGSLIYIAMEVIPDFARSRRARQFGRNMRDVADPTRGLRQAHRDVGLVGSVDAKKSLAEELLPGPTPQRPPPLWPFRALLLREQPRNASAWISRPQGGNPT